MAMRTPGRRYFESHWHVRLAGAISISMLAISVWFLYGRVEEARGPHNPHYGENHCFDCHRGDNKHENHIDCYECHDQLTRQLRPGAWDKFAKISKSGRCMHDLRVESGGERPVTALCLSCHRNASGYVALTNITDGKYVEIDITETHPIGLMPSETSHPKTLPLSRKNGAINCVTCHDQHATDRRLKMLRYYYPGNGHPPDFRPLCNDCHEEGWMPMKMRAKHVVQAPRRKVEE